MEKDYKKRKCGWKKIILFLSVFFIFSLACIIFSALVLSQIKKSFIQNNFWWLSFLSGVLFITFFILSSFFTIHNKENLIKTSLSIYLLVLFCLIFIFLLQITGFFTVFNDAEMLQEYLRKAGIWMPITYIVLQFLQVVILPVPGIVSTAAGVAVFGPLFTSIYSIIGILLGSFLAFYIGRKWGNRAVAWIIGGETLQKWQKKLKGKDNLLLTAMFFLPLFPDDILCFVAGVSSMSSRYFVIMITCSRVISIFATCYSVDFIPLNTWWGVLLWVGFFAVILLIFLLIYKHLGKIQKWIRKRFIKKKTQR